jgi:hypothetical protein
MSDKEENKLEKILNWGKYVGEQPEYEKKQYKRSHRDKEFK